MKEKRFLYAIWITAVYVCLLTGCSPTNQLSDSNSEWFAAEDRLIFEIEEADSPPEPVGGVRGVLSGMRYPAEARRAGVQGRVEVAFIVDEGGNVRNPFILKGIGSGCDEEALRLVRRAQFKPAMKDGIPVNAEFTFPIVFRLSTP